MKMFYYFLIAIVLVLGVVACTKKNKSPQNGNDDPQTAVDSCETTNEIPISEDRNVQTLVYNIDSDKKVTVEASVESGKARIRVLEYIENSQKEYMFAYTEVGKYYEIEGLQGVCKSIFWGRWGDASNPLLCMLMYDGGVEILDFNNATTHQSFLSSGRLPKLPIIVSFEQGNNEVLAIDSNGQSHIIELFAGTSGKLYHFEGEDIKSNQVLILSPDWKIIFRNYYDGGDMDTEYCGRFRGNANFDASETETYSYEFLKELGLVYNEEYEEEEVGLVDTYKKGSFKITRVKNDEAGYDFVIESSGDVSFARFDKKPRYSYKNLGWV